MVSFPETHAAGEVRIRVYAATVNLTDTYLRNDPPPHIPGMDIAGVIDEIGIGTLNQDSAVTPDDGGQGD